MIQEGSAPGSLDCRRMPHTHCTQKSALLRPQATLFPAVPSSETVCPLICMATGLLLHSAPPSCSPPARPSELSHVDLCFWSSSAPTLFYICHKWPGQQQKLSVSPSPVWISSIPLLHCALAWCQSLLPCFRSFRGSLQSQEKPDVLG